MAQRQNNTPTEQLAIACLVDSSLSLLPEWTSLLLEYIQPLLSRLHEHTGGRQVKFLPYIPCHSLMMCAQLLRVAVVVYAPASTRPRPILTTTYFGPAVPTVSKLRGDYAKFGIGQTGNGGGRGMAVLEGLVSTLEVSPIVWHVLVAILNMTTRQAFDQLKESEVRSSCRLTLPAPYTSLSRVSPSSAM